MIREGKSILNVMMITVLTRASGFAREIVLASVYGATLITDAYLISTAIPSIVFTSIGTAFATIFIPVYSSIVKEQDEREAMDFTNNILNIVLIITILLCFFCLLFAAPLVNVFASGFSGEAFSVAVNFTKIMLPAIIFIGINYIFSAYLRSNEKYEIPVVVKLPSNILVIVSIVISSIWNLKILLFGTLLGFVIQTIIQSYFVYKSGFKYKGLINFKDENIKKMLYLVMPVFWGTAVQQLNVLVDKTLASTLSVGSVSALNFADKLNAFVYGVFIISIITVIYPMLSKLASKGKINVLKSYIKKSINIIIIIMIPITLGAMCLCYPIVEVLFERGQFDSRATKLTSEALFFYSIGMIGFGFRTFLSRVFYSLQDTKTPVINAGIAMTLNIILNFILVNFLEHKGLALATSISSLFATILLMHSLRSKIGSIGGKKVLNVTIKVCIASLIMAFMVNLFYGWGCVLFGTGDIAKIIILLLSIIFGALIYITQIVFMNITEVNILVKIVKRRIQVFFK